METDHERFKREHPIRMWWEESMLAVQCWWFDITHSLGFVKCNKDEHCPPAGKEP